MSSEDNEPVRDNKRVIGLFGEMSLAMELHERGWQVYRAYIDENVDFIIARYYCTTCNKFSTLEKRAKGTTTFPSDCCQTCKQSTMNFIFRCLQVKTSEGISNDNSKHPHRKYSFHAKLRSNVDERSYYAWIALVQEGKKKIPYYYLFNHAEISKFDDLTIDSYQKTDNQKTTLRITKEGEVINRSKKYDFSYFNHQFHNDFECFEKIHDIDLYNKTEGDSSS